MLNHLRHGPTALADPPDDASRPSGGRRYARTDRRSPVKLIGPASRDDLALAALMTAIAVIAVARHSEAVDVLGFALAFVGTLSLAWRRCAPMSVLVISAGSFCLYQALGYPHPGLPFAMLVALYTVATIVAPVAAAVASGAAILVSVGSELVRDKWSPANFDDFFVAYLLAIGAACALGYGVQLIRARSELLREQADRLALEHAAHEQRILQSQRQDIARDLHDIVSHQVSLITALATGAGQHFDSQPERARTALRCIETAGREALAEMRRLLRVLRPEPAEPARAPQPGCADLPALIRQTADAGLHVDFRVHGEQRPVAAGVELCAYRIVQEALTNVLKHAGPAQASVDVSYRPQTLELDISDDGRGMGPQAGGGHGIRGMRERAALVGGRLQISCPRNGGVHVRACFPLTE